MGITPIFTPYLQPIYLPYMPLNQPVSQALPMPGPIMPTILREPPAPPQPQGPPPVNLVDPITSHRLKLESQFSDKLLRLSPKDKLKLAVKNTFVTIPKGIAKGLRGDSSYTFSDFLNIAHIPYYAGGAVLALSFLAGNDRRNFARQGVGVLLYYLGVMTANKGVNAFYKYKDGVDLDLRYRKSNGDIERVFASASFPRFDLLQERDYQRMMGKMGIPGNIANPHGEVHDQARRIINTSRADKLILGNILAAIGAGYLARSDAWARLLGAGKTLKRVLMDQNAGGLGNRIANLGPAIKGIAGRAFQEKITGYAGEPNPMMRKSILWAGGAILATVIAHLLTTNGRKRNFESPLYTAMAPEMNPGIDQSLPADKGVYRGSLFATFEQARANATVARHGGNFS